MIHQVRQPLGDLLIVENRGRPNIAEEVGEIGNRVGLLTTFDDGDAVLDLAQVLVIADVVKEGVFLFNEVEQTSDGVDPLVRVRTVHRLTDTGDPVG